MTVANLLHLCADSRARALAAVAACNARTMIDDACWDMAPPLDDTPRRLVPRSFTAHCEREPGRLQLRLVLARDEHVNDIVVEEDEGRIVAFAAVCRPTIGGRPEQFEGAVARLPR